MVEGKTRREFFTWCISFFIVKSPLEIAFFLFLQPESFASPAKNSWAIVFYLFFFPPARIRWIWSPRLNAWLKSNRVWNSETNGNHANIATGAKRISPIMYSYPLPRALTDPQNPRPFTNGLHDCDICAYDIEFGREFLNQEAIENPNNSVINWFLSFVHVPAVVPIQSA